MAIWWIKVSYAFFSLQYKIFHRIFFLVHKNLHLNCYVSDSLGQFKKQNKTKTPHNSKVDLSQLLKGKKTCFIFQTMAKTCLSVSVHKKNGWYWLISKAGLKLLIDSSPNNINIIFYLKKNIENVIAAWKITHSK